MICFLQKYRDLFQQLLNAVNDDAHEQSAEDDRTHEEVRQYTIKHVSKMEVLAQSFVLLIAGHALHFALYFLAKFPEIQQKAQEEIEQVVGESVKNPLQTLLNRCLQDHITYEHVTSMPYLSQVIYETLRIFPPAPQYV